MDHPKSPLISAEHLSISLGGRQVLLDVSLTVNKGEIVTLVGPNGSGKTTLIRALLGIVKPRSGQVIKTPGLRLGYVPQKLHLDASLPMTVSRFMNLPHRQPDGQVAAALTQAGVADLEGQQVRNLSGGQLQRVLLAKALLNDPQLLLLDEATQGLDQAGSAAFYRQIEQVRDQRGCAILMVSHELHVVMSASDRVICLNGHVCCHGSPEMVSANPAYLQLFGADVAGALALYRHEHDHSHHDENNRDTHGQKPNASHGTHHHHPDGCDHA